MKLLFLSPHVPHAQVVSGSIIVYHRMRLLAQRGHRIGLAVFADEREQPYLKELHEFVREIHWLQPPPRRRRHSMTGCMFCRLPKPFCACRSAEMHRLVGQMVERSQYEIAIAEFSVMGQYLYYNPYLPAVRRVISCHSCLSQSVRRKLQVRGKHPFRKVPLRLQLNRLTRIEFDMYRSADLVLALTPQEKTVLLQQEPNLAVAVSPYGVDIEPFDHYRRLRRKKGRTVPQRIIITGYFRNDQNRDAVNWFVHNVWPILKKQHPTLDFYIVGRSPPAEIRALSRHDDHIVVTGEVDDFAPYLAQSDVYVCPVRLGAGFRGRILQAMAAGVPVVTTMLGAEGIPVRTGSNMIFADTPSLQAASIRLLLTDPEYRQRISDAAFETVSRRFAWQNVVTPLERELQRLIR